MSSELGQPRRKLQIRFGTVRAPAPRPTDPRLCVVGICPPGWPWLSRRYPHARVSDTRFGTEHGAVEHLRFSAGQEVDGLPGLAPRAPSRVRDAVCLALAAGAPVVDVVLARAEGLLPWHLESPEIAALFDPFLNQLPEAVLVYPDAGGPALVGPPGRRGDGRTWHRVARMIDAHRAGWRERYQIALVDVGEDSDELSAALAGPLSADVALCRFSGPPAALARHGWRCAAAGVGGLLCTPGTSPMTGTVGRKVKLGAGRAVYPTRDVALGFARPSALRVASPNFVNLALDADGDLATVLSEPSLREPMGDWSLPALRTVKSLHHRIRQTADAFVFRTVDVAQGLALVLSLQESLRPFASAGILLGPDGVGPPKITGDIDKSPNHPGLIADIAAQLRPWCRSVNLRVAVRAGGIRLEVAA
jgi:hypothetical protein